MLETNLVSNKSPDIKSSRLTKLNIDQINNLNVEDKYKTVETDRSILDKFQSAKKSQEDL